MFPQELPNYFGKYCQLTNHIGDILYGVIVFVDSEGWVTLDWGFQVRAREIAKIEVLQPMYN